MNLLLDVRFVHVISHVKFVITAKKHFMSHPFMYAVLDTVMRATGGCVGPQELRLWNGQAGNSGLKCYGFFCWMDRQETQASIGFATVSGCGRETRGLNQIRPCERVW